MTSDAQTHSYYLAYFRPNVEVFFSHHKAPAEHLQYALVPAIEPMPTMPWYFDRCTINGKPLGVFHAMPSALCSIRRPDVAFATKDEIERQLIEKLTERARNAGYVLPSIQATLRMPGWSKLSIPGEVMTYLREIGGASSA